LIAKTVCSDRLQDDRHIPAGINHDALFGLGIEQDRAVLLERCYRNNPGLEHAHEYLASSF
jgi:hypothetical protein